jgi:hypothetical protein
MGELGKEEGIRAAKSAGNAALLDAINAAAKDGSLRTDKTPGRDLTNTPVD